MSFNKMNQEIFSNKNLILELKSYIKYHEEYNLFIKYLPKIKSILQKSVKEFIENIFVPLDLPVSLSDVGDEKKDAFIVRYKFLSDKKIINEDIESDSYDLEKSEINGIKINIFIEKSSYPVPEFLEKNKDIANVYDLVLVVEINK